MKNHRYPAITAAWKRENANWHANAFINPSRGAGLWQGRTFNSPKTPSTKRGLRRRARK